MEKQLVLGVDIGGSHITVAFVDLDKKKLLKSSVKRNLIDSQEEAEVILNAWCQMIEKAYQSQECVVKRIGIAMPGPFDYEEGISLIKDQKKFKSLYLFNIKEKIASRLGMETSHISFINDAAAFLQGEVFNDQELEKAVVLGLTLGTGLGSAVCVDGCAIDADLWNSSFRSGIAEDYLSTGWFVKRYHQMSGKTIKGVKELLTKCGIDEFAVSVFKEFGSNLALFLIPIVKRYNAEVVILGGNISMASEAFFPELKRVLRENQLNVEVKTTLLKENAALVGAASCLNIVPQIVIK